MRMVQEASCAQLGNTSYLREVIQTTGVTYDSRKAELYGEAAKYMLRTSTGQKIGLWQDPSQFATAMAYHGSSRHEIRSYIEVGCYTGWTALILATYLQRVGHRLRGYLIDLKPDAIGPVTRTRSARAPAPAPARARARTRPRPHAPARPRTRPRPRLHAPAPARARAPSPTRPRARACAHAPPRPRR